MPFRSKLPRYREREREREREDRVVHGFDNRASTAVAAVVNADVHDVPTAVGEKQQQLMP